MLCVKKAIAESLLGLSGPDSSCDAELLLPFIKMVSGKCASRGDVTIALQAVVRVVPGGTRTALEALLGEEGQQEQIIEALRFRLSSLGFPAREVKVVRGLLVLWLDRGALMRQVARVFDEEVYGANEVLQGRVFKLSSDSNSDEVPDLRQKRCAVIQNLVRKVVVLSKGRILETQADKNDDSLISEDRNHIPSIHFTTKHNIENNSKSDQEIDLNTKGLNIKCDPDEVPEKASFHVAIGPVLSQETGKKMTADTATYVNSLRAELQEASLHKEALSVDQAWFQLQAQNCINIILAGAPCQSAMSLAKSGNSRDAAFQLYNFSRCHMLLSRVEAVTEVRAFSANHSLALELLSHEEEWELVWCCLYRWPRVVGAFAEGLPGCEAKEGSGELLRLPTHTITHFTHDLCHRFSVYYNRVRILQGSGSVMPPHLLPLLQARHWLLQNLLKTLGEAFALLGVQPPTQM